MQLSIKRMGKRERIAPYEERMKHVNANTPLKTVFLQHTELN